MQASATRPQPVRSPGPTRVSAWPRAVTLLLCTPLSGLPSSEHLCRGKLLSQQTEFQTALVGSPDTLRSVVTSSLVPWRLGAHRAPPQMNSKI